MGSMQVPYPSLVQFSHSVAAANADIKTPDILTVHGPIVDQRRRTRQFSQLRR